MLILNYLSILYYNVLIKILIGKKMFNKEQVQEDIQTAKKLAPKVAWLIYHLTTIGLAVIFISLMAYFSYAMMNGVPEIIQNSKLVTAMGQTKDMPLYIGINFFFLLSVLLGRLIISFFRKRYFN